MIDLSTQTVLIIGGVHDLAVSAAASLHASGAKLLLAYDHAQAEHAEKHLALTNSRHLFSYIEAIDLSQPEGLTEKIASLGSIETAIISPSWFQYGEFLNTTPADWDAAFKLNFENLVYAAQTAARGMIAAGNGGRIILLSSIASLMPFTERITTGASLAAMWGMVKMIAVDLGPHNITANIVAAGWVETEWNKPHLTSSKRAHIERGIPLGRIGAMSDLGNACCFLASDMAAYITGTVIPIDGGYLLTRSDGRSPYTPDE